MSAGIADMLGPGRPVLGGYKVENEGGGGRRGGYYRKVRRGRRLYNEVER